MKVPEAVLEAAKRAYFEAPGNLSRQIVSHAFRAALEAALEQVREELLGVEGVEAAVSRFEDALDDEGFSFAFPESSMRHAIKANLNSVLGDKEEGR